MIDLVIDTVTYNPPVPKINQEVTVSITIRNQGNTDAVSSFYVDWYADRASAPAPYTTGNKSQLVHGLAAGETLTVELLPYTYTTAGSHSAWAQIDTDQTVAEADETNNVFGPQTVTVSDVDLRVSAITYTPSIARVGELVTVQVTVRNTGTTDAGTFWVDWYSHTTGAPAPHEVGDRYQQFSSLAAGASVTMIRTWTYTAERTNHTYAQVDTEEQVDETNETNNLRYARLHAVDGELIPFDLKEDTWNSLAWFGGDDRPGMTRNVGVGQSVTLPRTAIFSAAGFHFEQRFDYSQNPDGYGHAVDLRLYARNNTGTSLMGSNRSLNSSFNGGWCMFGLSDQLMVPANTETIFTCHLVDGEISQLYTSVRGRSDDPWPTSSGYYAQVYGTPADMTAWSNWETHPWDFNFALTGYYVEKYPGDLNTDRFVDLDDVVHLAVQWLRDDCTMPTFCEWTDVNWNKTVTLSDYRFVAANYGSVWDGYEDLNRAAIAKRLGDMSGASIDGSDGNEFAPGTYFIYRTSAGRFGKFIVTDFNHADLNKLTLDWITYNADGTVYSSGTGLVIRGTYSCDLDLGLETIVGSDFWWAQESVSTRCLVPQNAALFDLIYRAP